MASGRHLAWLGLAACVALGAADRAAAGDADLARGETLFALCAQCHGEQGEGNALFAAPAIGGLDQWYVELQLKEFRQGLRGAHFDDITGMRMRPMSRTLRTQDDVIHVSAYVASLPRTKPEPTLEGDATKGAAIYGLCAACHGPTAQGIQVMNAPSLNSTYDWYLVSQIEKFKSGVRGTSPKDTVGVLMHNIAKTLPDSAAIHDVVAHIMTFE